jgi:hypothetical protein
MCRIRSLILASATASLAAGVHMVAFAAGTPGFLPTGSEPVQLNPADFSLTIDNPYFPLRPGSRWVWRETAAGKRETNIMTVTNASKKVKNGVTARVVRDVARDGKTLVEVTDDWYAQDRAGNVWYFGEQTTEYKNGKPATTKGSFEAGVDGAQPGVIMPARPTPGLTYRQEYYKGQAEDAGEVLSRTEQVQVPFSHFAGAVLTRDLNRLKPKFVEYKFYAKGIGPVMTLGVSGTDVREELVSFTRGR